MAFKSHQTVEEPKPVHFKSPMKPSPPPPTQAPRVAGCSWDVSLSPHRRALRSAVLKLCRELPGVQLLPALQQLHDLILHMCENIYIYTYVHVRVHIYIYIHRQFRADAVRLPLQRAPLITAWRLREAANRVDLDDDHLVSAHGFLLGFRV